MIKGSIQEDYITLINIYATYIGKLKYIKWILTDIKGEIDNNTIVGDFNSPFTSVDKSCRQKINKSTMVLNDKINQLDLRDIYRTFHPQTRDYTFFSSAHRTFSRIYHMPGHKTSLNKFKRMEIISSCFFPTAVVWS